MHVHLPKPLHGWREFAGEVGIIVLGVLIALALEAIVERVNWHSKVAEARQELRYEVGLNLALLKDRVRQQPCSDRRLDQLGAVLNRTIATGELPPLGTIGQPSHYTWPTAAWETQMAAQTISHFPPHELASLARIYRLIGFVRQIDEADRAAWLSLSTMKGPGRPMDASTIDRLVLALTAARSTNSSFGRDKQLIDTILERGNPGKAFPEIDPANPPILVENKQLCGSISDQVPPNYGAHG